jgi:hypothetical protein
MPGVKGGAARGGVSRTEKEIARQYAIIGKLPCFTLLI